MATETPRVYTLPWFVETFKISGVPRAILEEFKHPPADPPPGENEVIVGIPAMTYRQLQGLPAIRKHVWFYEGLLAYPFAGAPQEAGYRRLLLPAPVPFADRWSFAALKPHLPENHRVAPVVPAVAAWAAHFAATGVSLGRGLWMWCNETIPFDSRVVLEAGARARRRRRLG